jgi:hypothetical protein
LLECEIGWGYGGYEEERREHGGRYGVGKALVKRPDRLISAATVR